MAYNYGEDLIREIKDKNDIVDVISEYINLKPAGTNYKGLCPFHDEKTASFVVSPEKQIFNCFGCGEGGDVISFVSKYNNMDFNTSLKELANRVSIELEDNNYDREKYIEKENIYKLNREAAIYFYKRLLQDENALRYLKNRGIGLNSIKKYGIGLSMNSWNGLLKYLESKNYEMVDLEKAGLVKKSMTKGNYYDRFRGRIMFPIWDLYSKIIGFGGRLYEDVENQPKYLNTSDTEVFLKGKNLYGLNWVKKNNKDKDIILTEGYMDVIALGQSGIENAVASLGTAFTKEQARLIKTYTEKIVIAYDSDNAGLNATKKAIEIIQKEGLMAKVMELEKGLDPDDYIKKYGKNMFEMRVENADHYIDFLIKQYKNIYNVNIIDEKLEIINKLTKYLKNVENNVELDIYIGKISKELDVSSDSIKKELSKENYNVKQPRNSFKRIEIQESQKKPKKDNNIQVELEIIKLMILDKNNIKKISKNLSYEDFSDDINSTVIKKFIDQGSVEESILTEEENKRIDSIKKIDLNLQEEEIEKAINDYINKIKIINLENRKEKILQEIKDIEKEKGSREDLDERLINLFKELTDINKELKLHLIV